jgi:hypothetical protein
LFERRYRGGEMESLWTFVYSFLMHDCMILKEINSFSSSIVLSIDLPSYCCSENHCLSALLYSPAYLFTCSTKCNLSQFFTYIFKTCTSLTFLDKCSVTLLFMSGTPQNCFWAGVSGDEHIGFRFHSPIFSSA